MFDHDLNNLQTTHIDLFKAFNEQTSKLFNVVYYKTLNAKYETAFVFKKTNKIDELLRRIGGTLASSVELIKLKKNTNSFVYEETTTGINLFYAFNLKDIKQFISVEKIKNCISVKLKDISNYKVLLLTQDDVDNKLSFILLYIYDNCTSSNKNKEASRILFDLKKAGDMCKLLVTFYYKYIINNLEDRTGNINVNQSQIKELIPSTIGFSSNDKLAALNAIFKQTNNVFFGDSTTKTLYIYNNENDNFNMNILYLWLNKFLCIDKYNIKYDIFDELDKNITNTEFDKIFQEIPNSQSITKKINNFVISHELTEINLKDNTMTPTDKEEYNIYIRVLLYIYLDKIKTKITENLKNTENNMFFVKLMFKNNVLKNGKYKEIIENIIKKLFEKINDIIIEIFDDIKEKLKTIDLIDPEKVHKCLSIINNLLTIIYVFLICSKNEIQIITEFTDIKKSINDIFSRKYYLIKKYHAANDYLIDKDILNKLSTKLISMREKPEKATPTKATPKKATPKKATPKKVTIVDEATVTANEIDSYINNFIVNIDIINYIMIFNKYYEYFKSLIENIEKNGIFKLDIDSINELINKIKVIYYYIYIQIYTEIYNIIITKTDLSQTIFETSNLKELHENIITSIIDNSTIRIINTIKGFDNKDVKGITYPTLEEQNLKLAEEKEKMDNIKTKITDGINQKITIINQNIQTLEIFNYKSNYTIDTLLKISFDKEAILENLEDDKFAIINQLIEQNEEILMSDKKIEDLKIVRIYNFLLHDSDISLLYQHSIIQSVGGFKHRSKKQMKVY